MDHKKWQIQNKTVEELHWFKSGFYCVSIFNIPWNIYNLVRGLKIFLKSLLKPPTYLSQTKEFLDLNKSKYSF